MITTKFAYTLSPQETDAKSKIFPFLECGGLIEDSGQQPGSQIPGSSRDAAFPSLADNRSENRSDPLVPAGNIS